MAIGPSIGDVYDKGLAEAQSIVLGMDIQPPEIEAASQSGPEIEAPAMSGPQIEAPAIQPMEMPEMEIE